MDIFKHVGGDCSNYGLSSKFDEVSIVDCFDKDAPDDAVVIVHDVCCGKPRIRAIPAKSEKVWTMFGGCFIYTCNGVVPNHGIAIPLHDRIEYNAIQD